MSTIFKGKVNFGGVFHPTGGTPLDDRTVVKKYEDLATLGSTVYKGMIVSVQDESAIYYLDADVCTPLTNWKKIIINESQQSESQQWEDIIDTE